MGVFFPLEIEVINRTIMRTIQSRLPYRTLDSPSLTENNTLHTFSQTSVENTRPQTPTGYNTVHTFSHIRVENSPFSNSNWVQYTAFF